uniref:Uncharacterized protein n=1 Tax=Magallana gigas TaxID=29159 RepID=A0A8W8KZ05_MAGGI
MSSNGRCQGDERSKNFIRSLFSDDGSKSTPRKVKQQDNRRTRYNEKKAALKASRTRAAKANVQEDYTAKDKEVNKSIRKDKRDHIDNLVKQAKEAAGQGNLRELYMVTMKLSNKFQQTYKPVKDKHRNLLQ